MNKKIDRLKIETLILTLFEIIAVGIFTTCYLLDIGNISQILLPEYVAIIYVGLLFLDCLYVFRMLFSVNKIRKQSDLRTVQLLGNDVLEAYAYAKMGLVVIDKEGVVLWESDYLYQQGIDIVNLNIFEWNKNFDNFLKKENDYKLNITIDNKIFSVKYLRTSGIFIFIDNSEYERLKVSSENQSICVGIIIIDNYAELTGNTDDANDMMAKVKSQILEYCKKYTLLLKAVRNDSYFVVCNYKSLKDMIDDNFSILEKVKNCGEGEHLTPTLTIGFGHGFPDVIKLNEMAANALEIAMSRGEDQVAVSKFESELSFYGGKTDTSARRSNVHTRMMADSTIDIIEKSSSVLIMGHQDMDMDALGAALGVYEMCRAVDKQSYIVYEPKLTEKKTRTALTSQFSKDELSKIVISSKEALDRIKPSTLLVVVDVSRPKMTMCPELLERTKKIIVIDHHRRAPDDIIEDTVLTYIEPSASSASELIAEMFKYSRRLSGKKIRPIIATFMLSGIFLDTGFFKTKNVGVKSFEACYTLKENGADNGLADDLLKDEYEEYIFINKILSTMKTPYYGIVYCQVDEDEIVERTVLAKVANQCINLKGINAAFVIGKTANDEVRISARSDGTVNVQVLCERLGGGGHFASAATCMTSQSISEVEERLLDVLESHLSEARSTQKVKGDQ